MSQVDPVAQDEANPLPRRTFNVTPLGLLQFRPIVQGEFKISRQGYLVPHVPIPYLGLLYHMINYDADEVSSVDLGIGAGYKTFFPPMARGAWYLVGALDYSFGSSTGNDGGPWESRFQNLAVMSNSGFRWRSANKRRVLSVGVRLPIQDEWSGPGTYGDDRMIVPMGMLELETPLTLDNLQKH